MIIRPLTGAVVVVTRPDPASAALSARIRSAGGEPVVLPGLHLEPIAAKTPLVAAGTTLLFVSANAVHHGVPALGGVDAVQSLVAAGCQLGAIGPPTAMALQQLGLPVAIVPKGKPCSENLLAEPALLAPPKNVLIVRGVGGRNLLAEELGRRGSSVQYLEVYRRVPSNYRLNEPIGHLLDRSDLIMSASSESLRLLATMVKNTSPEVISKEWRQVRLVVAAEHMLQTALDLGIQTTPLVAQSATDNDMFASTIIAFQRGKVAAKKAQRLAGKI